MKQEIVKALLSRIGANDQIQDWIDFLEHGKAQNSLNFECESAETYHKSVEAYQLGKTEVYPGQTKIIARVLIHQQNIDQRISSKIVKLHDIVANVTKGQNDTSTIVKDVLNAILLAIASTKTLSPFLLSVISSCCQNYRIAYKVELKENFVLPMSEYGLVIPLADITEPIFKVLVENCEDNMNHLIVILRLNKDEANDVKVLKTVARKLVLPTNAALNWQSVCTLISYLCLQLDADLAWLLNEALALWADPVIAKAYVYREVIHFTKISLLVFAHLSPESTLESQDKCIRLITQGLPHHFSSTDHRSIQLAKFFCEVITETLKIYEKRSGQMAASLAHPQDEVCQQLLQSIPKDKFTSNFWRNFPDIHEPKGVETHKVETEKESSDIPNSDDDDDDDLEPIETLEAPTKCDIAYIRDFIESLSEEKPYDERVATFSVLPNIIQHQIKLEHPQVAKQLLNLLIDYTNDFECPQIDTYRKRSLINSLASKMDGNVQHLCSTFGKTRVPQQALILEVLSTSASEASLANLQILAKSAFEDMLQIDLFQTREVPIRIPLIMFYHRLLSIMPVGMIQADMVQNYLKALAALENVDKATEQTISYSLHNLMHKLRDVQLSSVPSEKERISEGLASLRSWLCQVQSNNH